MQHIVKDKERRGVRFGLAGDSTSLDAMKTCTGKVDMQDYVTKLRLSLNTSGGLDGNDVTAAYFPVRLVELCSKVASTRDVIWKIRYSS